MAAAFDNNGVCCYTALYAVKASTREVALKRAYALAREDDHSHRFIITVEQVTKRSATAILRRKSEIVKQIKAKQPGEFNQELADEFYFVQSLEDVLYDADWNMAVAAHFDVLEESA